MGTSRTTTFVLSGLVGLGALVGLSGVADAAQPGPGLVLSDRPTTTVPPAPQDKDIVLPETDPQPDPPAPKGPGGITLPDDDPEPPCGPVGCLPDDKVGPSGGEDPCAPIQDCLPDDLDNGTTGGDPCDASPTACAPDDLTDVDDCGQTPVATDGPVDQDLPLSAGDDCGGGSTGGTTGGTTGGGTQGTTGGSEGTTGGTTNGTTGGSRGGSLPRTGAELLTLAGLGAATTGVGVALRSAARRRPAPKHLA